MSHCPSCQTDNPPEANYCSRCAHPLRSVAGQPETGRTGVAQKRDNRLLLLGGAAVVLVLIVLLVSKTGLFSTPSDGFLISLLAHDGVYGDVTIDSKTRCTYLSDDARLRLVQDAWVVEGTAVLRVDAEQRFAGESIHIEWTFAKDKDGNWSRSRGEKCP